MESDAALVTCHASLMSIDVSLTRSCRRLHHHVLSLLQRTHCFLLPQIGNNQPRPKPWSHSWKMFAVSPACNRDRNLADEPHWCSSVFGYRNVCGLIGTID